LARARTPPPEKKQQPKNTPPPPTHPPNHNKSATTPSGCLTLDRALGGGYPRGRIVEIFGPESSGKTTLALHAVAEAQRAGGTAVFVDAEHAFDAAYARRLGVNADELIVSQPDHGEQAFNIMDDLIRSGAVDVVVVDSVSALVPRSEIDGDIGMPAIGAQARLMSQALRKVAGNASKSGVTVIFINQLRYKVGVIYGSPETTSGGQALKFYASCRLDIRAREKIMEAGRAEPVGVRARVKVVKNKVAAPFEVAEFDILFGEGIHALGCVLDAAEASGVVERRVSFFSLCFCRCVCVFFACSHAAACFGASSPHTPCTRVPLPHHNTQQGAWYYFGEQRLGQGRDRALGALREDGALAALVEARVREHMAARRQQRQQGDGGPGLGDEVDDEAALAAAEEEEREHAAALLESAAARARELLGEEEREQELEMATVSASVSQLQD
jgi:protein RecA